MEADLLVHLGEIDERKLYLDRAFSSMYAFCTRDLGFSEGAAYNRITVARAARRLPAVIEAVPSGQVHLAGLRLLAPHLTEANYADLLQRSAGRTKEQIAELVAALAPRAPIPTTIRKLPDPGAQPARGGQDVWPRVHGGRTPGSSSRDEPMPFGARPVGRRM